MKIYFVKLTAFFSLLVLFQSMTVNAESKLNEDQAVKILIEQINKDKLYNSPTKLQYLSFVTEEEKNEYFDLAIREKHDTKCAGDPNTSPIVDRYRIDRITKNIQWYDPVNGDFFPYKNVLKERLLK